MEICMKNLTLKHCFAASFCFLSIHTIFTSCGGWAMDDDEEFQANAAYLSYHAKVRREAPHKQRLIAGLIFSKPYPLLGFWNKAFFIWKSWIFLKFKIAGQATSLQVKLLLILDLDSLKKNNRRSP